MRALLKPWALNSEVPGAAYPTASHSKTSRNHHLSYTRITKNRWKNITLPIKGLHDPRFTRKNMVQNHYVPPRNRIVPLKNHSAPPRNRTVPLKNRSVPPRNHIVPLKNHSVPPRNRTVPLKNHSALPRNRTEPPKNHFVPHRNGKYL